MATKIYIYCIIDSNGEIDKSIKGLKGASIYKIPYRDIGIVVSNLDEDIKDLDRTRVLEHEDVVERIMKKFTVLPIRFHTLFKKEEDVLSMVKNCYRDFRENLDRLRNKAEFSVRVIWPGDKIREQIGIDYSKRGHNVPEAPDSPGKRFIEEKFEKYKIDKELDEKADICIAIIDNFLNRFVSEKKLERLKSRNLLLNAFYLVEKERQGDFKEAFEHLRIAPGDFKYLFSGPWPPYNFIKIGYDDRQDNHDRCP